MTDSSAGTEIHGPHRAIPAANPQEGFVEGLFDLLWDQYRSRVTQVATYERVIHEAGGRFVNDHVAFRTIAGQRPLTGIASVSRLFEALGYRSAGCYRFHDKHLNAIHYAHPNREFPKIFVSELKSWELSQDAQDAIERTLASHRDDPPTDLLRRLCALERLKPEPADRLLETVAREFQELPWNVPEQQDVEAVNAESQYGAWVLLHGYNVNHFTSLVNSHGTRSLDDIEKTADALRAAGVPMKPDIEGTAGSILRQTATEACVIDVLVRKAGREIRVPWTYAYFELAERGSIVDPVTGQTGRFEGFLGDQATHLFEMTKIKGA